MTILKEIEKTNQNFLPIAGFKEHLKLGSGFNDDTLQDNLVAEQLRAALAMIEAYLGKAISRRNFSLTLSEWAEPLVQILPIAPVKTLISLKIIDKTGEETISDISDFMLVSDFERPRLIALSRSFPAIPQNGLAQLIFTAGLTENWADLSSDIAQAVMITATHFYENRQGNGKLPDMVRALLEKHRIRRLGKVV